MSTVELNQVMELEKIVKDGDWQAVMQVATWYDDASASNAESSQEVDDESMDHPIPREPPALLADSEPQVELPAVEPPAVDLEQRTEIELLLRHAMSIIICVSSVTELLFSKQQLTLSKRSKFTRSTWISSFERLKLQRKR